MVPVGLFPTNLSSSTLTRYVYIVPALHAYSIINSLLSDRICVWDNDDEEVNDDYVLCYSERATGIVVAV